MDKFLESIRDQREAEFDAKFMSRNPDNLNLQKIRDALRRNGGIARYKKLLEETGLATASLNDALKLGQHLGLLKHEDGIYKDWHDAKQPTSSKYIKANLENWEARRLFFYKLLPSKKFTAKEKAQYLAPFVKYLKKRQGEAELIKDDFEKQDHEYSIKYYFGLAKEYGFEKELDNALTQIIDPNDIQTAQNINKEMLDIYQQLTSASQLKKDLEITNEIFNKLQNKEDISKYDKQINS